MISLQHGHERKGTLLTIENFQETPDEELLNLYNFLVHKRWIPFNHRAKFFIPIIMNPEYTQKFFSAYGFDITVKGRSCDFIDAQELTKRALAYKYIS